LEGVAILTAREFEPREIQFDFEAVAEVFDVAFIDLPFQPQAEQAGRLATERRSVLLVIDGSADGLAAGLAAVRAWKALGVAPRQIFPVVVEQPGGISRRGTARLALLDRHLQPVHTIPHDRVIARLGLAEALASRAVHWSTTQAIREVLSVMATRREPLERPIPVRRPAHLAKRAPFAAPRGVSKTRSFVPATEGIKK
jgi:hypothetical protein